MEPTDEQEANHWKLGFLYYNPNDPKFMIPKRFGFGWTFNFASLWTYTVLIAIILVIYAIKHYSI